MVQVTGFSPLGSGFDSWLAQVGFLVDKLALGQIFSSPPPSPPIYFSFAFSVSFQKCSILIFKYFCAKKDKWAKPANLEINYLLVWKSTLLFVLLVVDYYMIFYFIDRPDFCVLVAK